MYVRHHKINTLKNEKILLQNHLNTFENISLSIMNKNDVKIQIILIN